MSDQNVKKMKGKVLKEVKPGEPFDLGPGETASLEVPTENMSMFFEYTDNYGNIYQTEANVNIQEMKEKGKENLTNAEAQAKTNADAKTQIKSKTKIVYYGSFKKRIPILAKTIVLIIILGIGAFMITGSIFPISIGLGVVTISEIIAEIYHRRVNKRYKLLKQTLMLNNTEKLNESRRIKIINM